ncbi:rod shape-determining protein [Aliiglaciecola sp. CAU 1673]|uniref:rod shape-determining protein n=1 Tax=Aliiglaciecola sp. CAU 1673 TaxID=3032595 RepID=UPI0023D9EFC7|nr:rod shape-determining protein [Aliiglaciecola sp. CAU 1673]MDF2177629.1 rod shape-determining protein [Aliiglaciecola sp. CAU 1673]
MLNRILSRFASVLYVQIWENRIKVTDVSNNESFDDLPIVVIQTAENGAKSITGIGKKASQVLRPNEVAVNPFSHPRVLLSDFYVGEKLLQHAFKQLSKIKSLRPRPRVIVHPMEKTEGGLTMIENRAFRELAMGAGAIEVKLYTGNPLSVATFDFDKIKDESGFTQAAPQSDSSASNLVVFAFYLVVIFLAFWHFGN